MPGRINDSDIQALRERVSIVDVVGDYTALKRAGSRLVGLCPFHAEKSPSFTVDPGAKLWHCLAGETGVITATGVRAIKDLAGETHRVLTTGGRWTEAPFRSYGAQRLWAVHLTRNRVTKVLHATDEHRWLLRGNSGPAVRRTVLTRQLKARDSLAYAFPRSALRASTPSAVGVAAGFTFGDGTRLAQGCRAYLHRGKDEALLAYFPAASRVGENRLSGGGSRLYVDGLPNAWKDRPSLVESSSYLFGWLAGYFAADGCVSTDGQVILSSARRDDLDLVRTVATRLGIGTYGVKTQLRTGLGVAPTALHHLTFVGSSLGPGFFILEAHRQRFQAMVDGRTRVERRGWVVRSVEPTERVEEVFCAEVPGTHAFALEDNILTGNCFGCQAGGDAIHFIREIEALSFTEAVERLAPAVGVTLRYEELRPGQRKALGRRTRLVAALAAAAAFYTEQLAGADGEAGRAYLAGRGVDAAASRRFQLGWGPDAWDPLCRHLAGEGFTPEEVVDAGLATRGQHGLVDRFRGRVIFPILDASGRDVIAFGGRVLPGAALATWREGTPPKYINSPESPVYRKSGVLYALNWARREIVHRDEVLVVEGYMDALALHLAGVGNAVATCGTALTEEHFRQLERFAGRVVLALDADDAGYAAADRARGLAEAAGVREVGVLALPPGEDPADLAQRGGAEAVTAALAATKTAVAFQLEQLLRGARADTPEAQIQAYRETFPLLARLADRALRYRYIRDLVAPAVRLPADRIELELDRSLAQASAPGPRRQPARPAEAVRHSVEPQLLLERNVLQVALQRPDLLPAEWGELAPEDFTADVSRTVFSVLRTRAGADLDTVLAALPDDALRARVRALALDGFDEVTWRHRATGEIPTPPTIGKVAEVIRDLRHAAVSRRLADAEAALRRLLEEGASGEAIAQSGARAVELRREQRRLREPLSAQMEPAT